MIAHCLLDELSHPNATFRELRRVSRSGAVLSASGPVVVDPSQVVDIQLGAMQFRLLRLQDVLDALREASFIVKDVRDLSAEFGQELSPSAAFAVRWVLVDAEAN